MFTSSHIVGALTGAGGETVVEGVAKGARGVHPGPADEAGGAGGLADLAAALCGPPRLYGAAGSVAGVRAQAAGAAVAHFVQRFQGDVQRGRLVGTDRNLFLFRKKKEQKQRIPLSDKSELI